MLLCCPPLGLRGKQPARRSAPIPGGLHGDPKATYGVTRHRQAPTLPAGSPPCPAEERALHTAPSAPAWVAASPTTAPPPPPQHPQGQSRGTNRQRSARGAEQPNRSVRSGPQWWHQAGRWEYLLEPTPSPPQDRTHTAGPPPSFLQHGGPGPPIPPARTPLGRLRAPRGTLTECTERWNKPPLSALHTRRWRGPARRGPPPPPPIPAATGRVPGVPISDSGHSGSQPRGDTPGAQGRDGSHFSSSPSQTTLQRGGMALGTLGGTNLGGHERRGDGADPLPCIWGDPRVPHNSRWGDAPRSQKSGDSNRVRDNCRVGDTRRVGGSEEGERGGHLPRDKPRPPARTLRGWAGSGIGGTPTSPKVPSRGYGGSIAGTRVPPRPGIAFLWGGGVRGRPPPRQPNGCAGGISSRSLRSALPAPGGSPGKQAKGVGGGGDAGPPILPWRR